jgi:hypothetical protein
VVAVIVTTVIVVAVIAGGAVAAVPGVFVVHGSDPGRAGAAGSGGSQGRPCGCPGGRPADPARWATLGGAGPDPETGGTP